MGIFNQNSQKIEHLDNKLKQKRNILNINRAVSVFILLILIFMIFGSRIVDYFMHPWAHSPTGRPSLLATWVGELYFEGRTDREIKLLLWRDLSPNHGNLDKSIFYGTAQIADENGFIHEYKIAGRSNRDASEVFLKFDEISKIPSAEKQPFFQELIGSWDGEHLRLVGTYSLQLFDGRCFISYVDDPVRMVTGKLHH